MEGAIFEEFKEARKVGKVVGALWLDAMQGQSFASSILKGWLILSQDACFTPALSSLIAGFKAIDDGSEYPTVVGLG